MNAKEAHARALKAEAIYKEKAVVELQLRRIAAYTTCLKRIATSVDLGFTNTQCPVMHPQDADKLRADGYKVTFHKEELEDSDLSMQHILPSAWYNVEW